MKIEASGILIDGPLHDSVLVAISHDKDSCSFVFESDSHRCTIELKGITDSNFVDFKFKAILGEVFVWRVSDAPHTPYDVQQGQWETLFHDVVDKARRESVVQAMRRSFGDMFLVEFNFSYGGSLALICKDVVLTRT